MFLPDRIAQKIDFGPSCWLWMGATQSRGYGSVSINGRSMLAHRVVFDILAGPIPDDLTLDHLCLVKRCVNPAHLEAVPRVVNQERWSASVTHCLRGHVLSGGNVRVNGRGHRSCKTCQSERQAARRLKAV